MKMPNFEPTIYYTYNLKTIKYESLSDKRN